MGGVGGERGVGGVGGLLVKVKIIITIIIMNLYCAGIIDCMIARALHVVY